MGGEEGRDAAEVDAGYDEPDATPTPPAVAPSDGQQERVNDSEHHQEDKPERRWFAHGIRPAEWVMIALTAATAVAAIAGTTIANGQLTAMRGQLAEMRASSNDTHQLAVATEDFANAMQTEAGSTNALVGQAKTSAGSAQKSAVAATGQLQEMQDEQRPNIDIQSAIVSSPLIFNKYGAHLRVAFNLRNVGKTIGAADIEGRFILKIRDGQDITQELSLCKTLANENRRDTIYVAPDSAQVSGIGFSLAPDQLALWRAAYNPTVERVVPMLVGCVDYPYRGHHFQRGFIYEVDKVGTDQFSFDVLDPTGADIPQNQVALATNPTIAPYVQ